MVMRMSEAYSRNATGRIPPNVATVGKFIISGVLTAVTFIGISLVVWGEWLIPEESAVVIAILALSPLMALPVHFRAPDSYQDRFHKLGTVFAMFIPVNIAMSLGLIVLLAVTDGYFLSDPQNVKNFVWTFSIAFAGSSVFLPAPYAATVLAMRWDR